MYLYSVVQSMNSTVSPSTAPVLADYDVILINSSAGKDSQAMLDHVSKIAARAGVSDRIVVVHCDLGELEWEGTLDLAREQAAHYSHRFEVVRNEERNLLEQVEWMHNRRVAEVADPDNKRTTVAPSWPSSAARWCTSDHKRGPVNKLITRLVNEQREAGLTDRPVRVLNVMGLRAEESCARAKKVAYRFDEPRSNGKRHVDEWLPILNWNEQLVWATIKASGVRYHWAYDKGMGRLSCKFCVLATKEDLVCSAKLNPQDAHRYAAVEERIGFTFTAKLSMAQVIEEAGV